MVTKIEPIAVDTFAAGLSNSFLACRELGHMWKPWRAEWSGELRAYERELRCSRCKTFRRQLVNDQGHVLSNNYRYADGYQAKNVENVVRVSRDVFRLEALTRYLSNE